MNTNELTAYLHRAIPLAAAMGATAVAVSHGAVTIRAPHDPNVNHQGTVFGGSLSSLAILAGFAVVVLGLRNAGLPHRVVIQRNVYHYRQPANGWFEAVATLEDARWNRLVKSLDRRNRGRIVVRADVHDADGPVGDLEGTYAALPPDPSSPQL